MSKLIADICNTKENHRKEFKKIVRCSEHIANGYCSHSI